jgi:hypothetical protein
VASGFSRTFVRKHHQLGQRVNGGPEEGVLARLRNETGPHGILEHVPHDLTQSFVVPYDVLVPVPLPERFPEPLGRL